MLKHWSNPPPPPEKTFPPLKQIWVSLPPLKIWARYRPSPSKKKLMWFQFSPPIYNFPLSESLLFLPSHFLNYISMFCFSICITILLQYMWTGIPGLNIFTLKIQYASISCINRSVSIKIDLWSIPLNKYEYY